VLAQACWYVKGEECELKHLPNLHGITIYYYGWCKAQTDKIHAQRPTPIYANNILNEVGKKIFLA
jgi:hypothetical protein